MSVLDDKLSTLEYCENNRIQLMEFSITNAEALELAGIVAGSTKLIANDAIDIYWSIMCGQLTLYNIPVKVRGRSFLEYR